MLDLKPLLATFCLLLIASAAPAQPSNQEPPQFDLVIFGNNLKTQTTKVWLKENPGTHDHWQQLDGGKTVSGHGFSTVIYSNLSTARFAGQDIRENYIAVKIGTANSESLHIRAAFALPHLDDINQMSDKIRQAIQLNPKQLQQHSIASLLLPRPQTVSPDQKMIEHIEMPVRPLKPGVQEVRWLDILFSK